MKMKRIICALIAALLLATLAAPALADAYTLYTAKDNVKVYKKRDTDSKVLKKIKKKGTKLLMEQQKGNWYAILVEDPSGDGQTLGWIRGKDLTTNKSEKKDKKSDKKKKEKKATAKPKATATPKPTVNPQKEIDRVLASMDNVTPYLAEVVTKTENGTVALRWQPTKNGQLIYQVENGHIVTVLAEGDGWYQVRDDEGGYTGFMSSAYLAATAGIAEDDEVGEVELETLEGRTVEPETTEIDVNNLEDGVYPVAFDRGDVAKLSSGTFMNAVRVYTEDWYDIVDINTLAAGDTIVVGGESIAVNSVDRGDKVAINGGLDAGGIDLISVEDSNGYRVQDYDDASSYTLRGTATLTLAENATFTDGSDIESDPVTAQYEGIVEALNGAKIDFFSPNNTTVRIENGRVVEINRVYVP